MVGAGRWWQANIKHRAWTRQMRGFVRPMEHVMFYESIKPKNYLTLHELQRVDEMPAEFQQFLQKFRPEAAQKLRLRTVPQAAAAPAVVLAAVQKHQLPKTFQTTVGERKKCICH